MRIATGLAGLLAVFSQACGTTAMQEPSSRSAAESTPAFGTRTSATDGASSYGAVVVEAVEEDGSEVGLGVSETLVIHLDEVREALPLLASAELAMLLMVQAHRLDDMQSAQEVFSLIQQANQQGVEVRPIPVLSADIGYFPNATNVDEYTAAVRALVKQWDAHDLKPTTLIVDMEPPRELTEALSEADVFEAVPAGHIDRERYARSQVAYASLVDELHDSGWRVAASTQGSLLADYRDEDDDMRQYFNVILEGVDWDELTFQLYRSIFSTQAEGLDSHFVYEFARTARARFPDTSVGVDVGVIHPGPVFPDMPVLPNPTALQEDVGAALAAGIDARHIGVYNLKGILRGAPRCGEPCDGADVEYGPNQPESWLVAVDEPTPPPESEATSELWSVFDAMDALLDLSEASRERP